MDIAALQAMAGAAAAVSVSVAELPVSTNDCIFNVELVFV
jgi:hypothetical protein